MAGRNETTEFENIENRIRTYTWYKYVLDKTGKEKPNQLKVHFENILEKNNSEGKSKRFNGYAPESTTFTNVSNTKKYPTLDEIEKYIAPGSKAIHKNGPRKSFLFFSMFEDIHDIIHNLESQEEPFFWLSPAAHELRISRAENPEVQALYDHLNSIFVQNKVFETRHHSDAPESFLIFLSGCIIILRHWIERDRFISGSNVDDLLNLIFKIIEQPEVRNTLEYYSIRELFLHWLFLTLKKWCNYSDPGHALTHVGLPTLEEFINNPATFLKRLLEAYESCFDLYSDQRSEKIEINKYIKIKESSWFST